MQPYVRLREERRTSRRTIADALGVVWQEFGLDVGSAEIRIGPVQLPSGLRAAIVDVVFPDLGCAVSLPTSSRFKALHGTWREELEISRLDRADGCSDGFVQLADGTRLRAVEVIPTRLPYEPSELDKRILEHVISLTGAKDHCYRSIREGLPEHLRNVVPDIRVLDFSRVRTIRAPLLKEIRGYISDHDPDLRVSNQKIADALAMFGIRVPRRRRRATPATF
jgi:hypothetical protein